MFTMPKAPKWINDTLESLLSPRMPLMRVVETVYVNPTIKKISLKGDVKGMHFPIGYAIAVRVSDTEYRNYTPVYNDQEKDLVELIIHLHGATPGSQYMDHLAPGDEIRLVPPRGKKMYNNAVKQQFFFGDETSLALACSFQHVLKTNKHLYHYYFELDPVNNNIPALLGLDNYTIVLKGETFNQINRVGDLSLFQTTGWQQGNFIITGNAQSVQTIRKALKQHAVSGSIMVQAYWAEGKTGL
jgi:NADPH-dependent ferric siderophore reductase